MVRKRNERTREKLLEQGIQLITEHGYHGTGLKKILDTVNVPKGSFYNYFDSKEKYVAQIIRRYSDTVLEKVDAYLEATDDDPVTAIRTLHHMAVNTHGQKGYKGCLTGNLTAEIGDSIRAVQMGVKDAVLLWQSRVETLIEKGQSQGMIRNDMSASMLADILWDIWQGGLLRLKIDHDPDDLKEIIDHTLDILFKAG